MNRWRLHYAAASLSVLLFSIPATAEEPANYRFSPAPPGRVASNQLVYLAGEAMHSQWRAVASRKLVGVSGSTAFDQWYLSVYQLDGTTYKLKYRSPGNGGPLETVTQASDGVKMWYPLQSLQIVGNAELMQAGVQQLVVRSHEAGADCGAGTVSIFAADARGNVVPAVSVRNGCELRATISRGHGAVRDSIVLSGPYYSASAPMCCPTKVKAAAVLSYRNGHWIETPKYYQMFAGKLPPS